MAPTLAMSSTGVQPAGLVGRAAPLAFVFAAAGVGLVSYGFVRLSATVGHAGSVYAFVGRALGPRGGFVCGWALLGTYLVFPAVSMAAFATFSRAFLDDTGIWTGAPWLPLALAGWALMGVLASRQIRTAARSLLAFEAVSMALILALVVVATVAVRRVPLPRGRVARARRRVGLGRAGAGRAGADRARARRAVTPAPATASLPGFRHPP
jgi:amino acid transporter